jgi:DNA ligase-1
MLSPAEVIVECSKVGSTLNKQQILASNDTELLRKVLEYALDPYRIFGVKKFTFADPHKQDRDLDGSEITHSDVYLYMFECLDKLMEREITGDAARSEILKVSKMFNEDEQFVFERILWKDLKCGVAEGLVNRVFPKLIPEFEVQLAQPSKFLKKVIYPCIVQPKMDGVRTIAIVDPSEKSVIYYSRNGKEFLNFKCFDNELLKMSRNNSMVFDGEVIGSTKGREFDQIMNQCRRKYDVNPTGLNFHVFDVMKTHQFTNQKVNMKQLDRTEYLEDLEGLLIDIPFSQRRITFVDYLKVDSEEQLMRFYDTCIQDGFEGIIIKQLDGEYEFKRSSSWIKLKPNTSEDLKVVEIQEGKGKYEGLLGALIVDREGVKINVGSGFKDDERISLEEANKLYIGNTVEVIYDSVTKDGSLRFPRFKTLRHDK